MFWKLQKTGYDALEGFFKESFKPVYVWYGMTNIFQSTQSSPLVAILIYGNIVCEVLTKMIFYD